ncbi:MAG: MFS transporter [Nitrososphaera sp.]|nr:MAG: MFS transporter [Nitrososphaera sp.]
MPQAAPSASSSTGSSRLPWAIIAALSLGMLVYGVGESFAPATAVGNLLPSNMTFLAYSLPYIAGGFGALLSGWMADALGRRNSFIVTAALIVIGVVLYEVYTKLYEVYTGGLVTGLLIASFVLLGMAAIGLESPVLAMLAEAIPARWRGNLLVIVQNFGNLGVAITFIPVLMGLTGLADMVTVSLLFIAPLAGLIIALIAAGESIPWSAVSGKSKMDVKSAWQSIDGEAKPVEPSTGLWLRLLVLIVLGIAQDVAFVYITYGVTYSYFSQDIASLVPIVGGLTMVVVGIIFGMFFVERIKRKALAVLSFGMQAAFWAILWAFVASTGSTAGLLLLALMTIQFLPVELTWASRAVLEPELFPTRTRGRLISAVRTVVWIVTGIITGVLTFYLPPFNVAATSVFAIFLISVITAGIWWSKGFETSGKSLSGHDVL